MTKTKAPARGCDLACDAASRAMLDKAAQGGDPTAFARFAAQGAQCSFGASGLCCRICHMGPCRVSAKNPLGVCGADAATIVARNFLREAAAGTAAHSDHARHLALLLKKAAQGLAPDYAVRDQDALRRAAGAFGVETAGREPNEIALALADRLLDEFTSQEEPLATPRLAPKARQNVWTAAGVWPRGIDRTVVESLHRTNMGVDHEAAGLVSQAFRVALADGWGGSRIAAMVGDILFGTPMPVKSRSNLGVLRADTVNVLVHGHEPALSEMLAAAARDPLIVDRAKAAGACGLTLAGICCTANEILMRHGIPVAGNFLQQELAVITGAVEVLITDVQCVMPGLPLVAAGYHTKVVSTSDLARTKGASHRSFDVAGAYAQAKDLLLLAIENFANRDPDKVSIPDVTAPLVAGFSVEAIKYMLGGRFRGSFRPLSDAIISGRIKGLAGIVGCNNPKSKLDAHINAVTLELIKNDVLVLKTGCAALASAKAGMLAPEAALEHAGAGLREVCEAVGMPPVLHMGSCVDNARLLEAAAELVAEGGLGADLCDPPIVGLAPEWMSEKAVAIGCYFVASGVDVILGNPFHVSGSQEVSELLGEGARAVFGAGFHYRADPAGAARLALEIIEAKRARLNLDRKAERKLFDMKDRRSLNV
ncbi:MAG: anaerobic carbon-monoxide dehydrogenase catalytic subunit [Desulfovibrionaceae bacterium]|nr:anaerobic carbon-monoxide dehydrogenase catalytic subunit [Desulfovibrionaceae bacterium]MBF0514954.1 anaerobic carbon-monoxide dehydrogenase catalytic subunit [Desulfovibrionaceae bacterium]